MQLTMPVRIPEDSRIPHGPHIDYGIGDIYIYIAELRGFQKCTLYYFVFLYVSFSTFCEMSQLFSMS